MMLKELNPDDYNLSGSTACCLNSKAYIIGGSSGRQLTKQPYLQINCLDLKSKQWISTYNNTNGVQNRSFHSTCILDSNIYVFGGCTDTQREENSDEIITITESELGLVSSKHSVNECISRQGQSALLMGKTKQIVVFYGGFCYENDPETLITEKLFLSDLWSFSINPSDGLNFLPIDVSVEEECPLGRAFHTAVVSGDENELMIVCGGRNTGSILSDIWLLDMSLLLKSEVNAPKSKVPKPVSAKGKKGKESSTPCARWFKLKLPDNSFFPPR